MSRAGRTGRGEALMASAGPCDRGRRQCVRAIEHARYGAQQGCPPAGAVPNSHWVRTARKLWENRAALPKQVYLAAAFDLGGGYDGNSGPPPSGSPVVVHGSTAPEMPAAAVETGGEETAVTVTFDDTILMP